MIRRHALGLLAANLAAAAKLRPAAAPEGTEASLASFQSLTTTTPGLQVIAPSNSSTVLASGHTQDWESINAALAANGPTGPDSNPTKVDAVLLLPGVYHLDTGLTVGGTMLAGSGPGTWLSPITGFSGSAMITMGEKGTVRDLQVYGGSNTRANNPENVDAIALTPGASFIFIENVYVSYVYGWVLNAQGITGAIHLSVKGLRATRNAGGITCTADPNSIPSGATGLTAQIALTDIDVQQCEINPALVLQSIYDIGVHWFNCSAGGPTLEPDFPTIQLLGGVTTALFSDVDAGVYTDTATDTGATAEVPVLLLASLGTGTPSPTDISFSGCTFQQGGIGIQVQDDSSRLRFANVMSKSNIGDGWYFNGTGTCISVTGCSGYDNKGNDVTVTNTAYLGLFGFGYCSQNSATVPASALSVPPAPAPNNVTNACPTYPGQRSNSGTPSTQGWTDPPA